MTTEEKVKEIINRLSRIYPNPRTALNYRTPLQLLVATILSAQATDKIVNQVTPNLFRKYTTAKGYADADPKEFDKNIIKINFHNNKAKNIQAACKIIAEKYGGKVPDNMEELDALPGVARKTANVILGSVFKKAEGIVVDTHVIRLSRKLGLTDSSDPVKIEQDLMKIVPKDKWIDFSHYLINYGREFCPARPHDCTGCVLRDLYKDRN